MWLIPKTASGNTLIEWAGLASLLIGIAVMVGRKGGLWLPLEAY